MRFDLLCVSVCGHAPRRRQRRGVRRQSFVLKAGGFFTHLLCHELDAASRWRRRRSRVQWLSAHRSKLTMGWAMNVRHLQCGVMYNSRKTCYWASGFQGFGVFYFDWNHKLTTYHRGRWTENNSNLNTLFFMFCEPKGQELNTFICEKIWFFDTPGPPGGASI